MNDTAPIEMDGLVEMAKVTLTLVVEEGQFFFPKLLVGKADGTIQVCQTDSSAEAFLEALTMYSTESKLDWLAYTSDSYQFQGDIDKPEDRELVEARQRGEVKLEDLFEDDDPRVTEAISIILATRQGIDVHVESTFVAYSRLPGNKIVYGKVWPSQEELGAYGSAMREAILTSG